MVGSRLRYLLFMTIVAANSQAVSADAVADFYHGKTVNLQVGTAPGGGFDLTARIFAQTFGEHIPGRPTIVIQNVPGGGGLREANELFNSAPRDGTTIGEFSANEILEPLYGNKEASYDALKFNWLGSMDSDIQACGVWKGAGLGIKTFNDFIHAKHSLTFGSTAPSAGTTLYPLFLKNAFGAPVKVINGYPSTKDVDLAMARGELDATCGITQATNPQELRSGDLKVVVHLGMGRKAPPDYGDAIAISDVLTTDELRKIGALTFDPNLMTRPLAAPPGTPSDRVAALRIAFDATEADIRTKSAAAAAHIGLTPLSGSEMERMIAGFEATPPDLVKKAYDYTHRE